MLQSVTQTRKPQAAPISTAKAVDSAQSAVPIDVANFRLLPVAGPPLVSAEEDPTLGTTGLVPAILNKLQGLGPLAQKLVGGVRVLTRVIGPGAYVASAYLDAQQLVKVLPNKQISPVAKGVLATGTGLVSLGALSAVFSALPKALISRLGMTAEHLIQANKVSGIAGGLAGMGFASVDLAETCSDPKSTPTQRFFAKAGFGVGLVAFLTGTSAMLISMGVGGAAVAAAVPLLSTIATVAGLVSMGTWAGQTLLGKNAWLNQHLRGTILG